MDVRAAVAFEAGKRLEVTTVKLDGPKAFEVMGVNLHLSAPDSTEQGWIGQDHILRQLLACWLVVDPSDRPLSPRLLGPPGIGKTTLAMAAAQCRDQPLFINQCTADTRPEDLLVTPVLAESGKIAYHASPLVSASLKGFPSRSTPAIGGATRPTRSSCFTTSTSGSR